jgi:hypothetical protein
MSSRVRSSMAVAADLVCVALLICGGALAIGLWRLDAAAREPIKRAARQLRVPERRAADFESLDFAPAADLSADILADVALRDVLDPVSLASLSGTERQMWLETLAGADREVAAARDALLTAVVARPGWAYHWSLLGQLQYLDWKRSSLAGDVPRRPWIDAMHFGMALAHGDRSLPGFLSGAYIENWTLLDGAEKADAERTTRIALSDPDFVSRALRPAISVVGKSVIGWVPNEAAPLRAALALFLGPKQPVEITASLSKRWEAAERSERAAGIDALRKLARGSEETIDSACSAWAAAHPIFEFDDAQARAETAELLRLWPGLKRGAWESDSRAAYVFYFLDGRMSAIAPEAVGRIVESLSEVPAPIRARVDVAGGNVAEAEAALRSAETPAPFAWTAAVLDLARYRLRHDAPAEAEKTLALLSPAASDECEALMVRRSVARALGRRSEADQISAQLALAAPRGILSTDFAPSKSVSLCIDPETLGGRSLHLVFSAPAPALVSYGWDGARMANVLVDNRAGVTLPLLQLPGRHSLFARSIAGANIIWEGSIE